jgi:acylphosphatase
VTDVITRRLRITGRVQGVGYRDWTIRAARGAGLTGWVRNRADGAVEAVVRGSADAVDSFVTACHAGPPHARVTAVETSPETEHLEPGFRQFPTI